MSKRLEPVEVAIVGGGIGGIATALWCRRLALRCALLERSDRLGGQLHAIHFSIPDFPGVMSDGPGFADKLASQLKQIGIVPQLNTDVQEVDLASGCLLTNQGRLSAQAIVAATGARRRRLSVPGAEALLGKGLSYTFSGDKGTFIGRPICIVGGGDGAFENALHAAACCPHITLVVRSQKSRARKDFIERVMKHPKIEVLFESEVSAIHGEHCVTGASVQTPSGARCLDVKAVLIKIGLETVTSWLPETCKLTEHGTLPVDDSQRTPYPRLWSVGDLCTGIDPSLSAAVGQASMAVRDIKRALHPDERASWRSSSLT